MCGFVGCFDDLNRHSYDIDSSLKLIYHRGPDSQKVENLDAGRQLGFARLAIIDISGGDQPMKSDDGKITMVFNGEIYNYVELKEMLNKAGCNFKTSSDTEVLLLMYQKYGLAMLEQIEGMFSVAIIDDYIDEVFLIRDKFGIKPLYYCTKHGVLSFASEVKALLRMPNVSKQISNESIYEFLSYEYVSAPNTIFEDVKKLLPGHYLQYSNGNVLIKEYWDCRDIESLKTTYESAKIKIVEMLKKSVKLHMRSDVPLGFFLSGGIDSGLLVALASEIVDCNLNTYTLKFENGDFDESKLAEMISNKYNTNHKCFTVSDKSVKYLMPEMMWHCDEPLGDSGILPNYIINQKVSQDNIKVVISGAGGDELFAGYNYYFGTKKERLVSSFPLIANIVKSLTSRVLPKLSAKIKKALILNRSSEAYMFAAQQIVDSDIINKLLKAPSKPRGVKQNYHKKFKQKGLNGLLYCDIKTYLTDDLLLLADRTTMAHSIEGRVPYLYSPLVTFALSINSHIKAPNNKRKWLLKDIAKDYLPQEIFTAPKMGFCSPIETWSKGEIGRLAYKILNSSQSINRPFWNKVEYKKFVQDKNNYKHNFTSMYLFFVLEMFLRIHVDNSFDSIEDLNLEKVYGF